MAMRAWWMLMMAVVLVVGGGCVAVREPVAMVEPDYSYLRDEPGLSTSEIWPVLPDPLAEQGNRRRESSF